MTSFRRHIRRLFSAVSGSVASAPAARGAALAGIGLSLLLGVTAQANEIERGEAEQAPPGVVGDPEPAQVQPEAPISPARVVAHTAQLPKASPNANSKPLLAADLANDISRSPPAQGVTTTSQSPSSQSPAARSKTAATKANAARRTHLPLAPSAGEIRREIAARNGGQPTVNSANPSAGKESASAGARLQQEATAPPQQNPRWPTHVDYTAGPTGPAGPNTAAERKGAMIESAGPQQGVIRNQW